MSEGALPDPAPTAEADSVRQEWYVIYAKGQYEKRIADYLKRRGTVYYLPLVKRRRRWSDRFKFLEKPLFPGYLFVLIDYRTEAKEILRHRGVIGFVKKDGQPAVMPASDVENIRRIVAVDCDIQANPTEVYPPGQPVLITDGPFKGIVGTVMRVKNKTRLVVELPLLNQTVSAEVDALDVEKAQG